MTDRSAVRAVVAAVFAVFVLTGCAAQVAPEAVPASPTEVVEPATPTPTPSSTPTPSPTPTPKPTAKPTPMPKPTPRPIPIPTITLPEPTTPAQKQFVALFRLEFPDVTKSDAEILAMGNLMCAALKSGNVKSMIPELNAPAQKALIDLVQLTICPPA